MEEDAISWGKVKVMTRKPAGWRREPARHALAAHGVKTKPNVRGHVFKGNESNGPSDEEANQWAWDHYQLHWNALGSKEMDEFYAEWEKAHSEPEDDRGKIKYCGYEVGVEITSEEIERLWHFIHANYTHTDLIQMNDKQLHEIAEDNQNEWRTKRPVMDERPLHIQSMAARQIAQRKRQEGSNYWGPNR